MVFVKNMLGYDDALDTFGVHAVGGTLGAHPHRHSSPPSEVNLDQPQGQRSLKTVCSSSSSRPIALTLVLSIVGTSSSPYVVKAIVGLRPTPEVESQGLDITEHGEEGYIL